jgi:peptidyl-prolyl cis-trans isomerase SurA
MNPKPLLVIAAIFATFTTFSQTLFTYGPYSVSATEFVRAYTKNNTGPTTDKAKAMREYLDLYINSRLKIREALDRRYDTLPDIKAEVENLRGQIIENYMNDPETMDRLTGEAFIRSQKDIHAGHIFIPVANDDTVAAWRQANDIISRLNKGEEFSKVAVALSQDPGAVHNKGDIGWVTVFTLPYPFETVLYSLNPGTVSAPIRSKAGYHIFKNIAERKAIGKIKAKQILLAFPPNADAATKAAIAKRADSLYKKLLTGADFDKLAEAFSNDYLTSVTGGSMPDFGTGQYDAAFEDKVWALAKDGAITKPFVTAHGYHIVKRVSRIPVETNFSDKLAIQNMHMKIMQDPRWKTSKEIIYNRVKTLGPITPAKYSNAALWAYTDSMIDRRPIGAGADIRPETAVFSIGDSVFTARNWLLYAQTYRYKTDGSGIKPYQDLMSEYTHTTAQNYYRDHLEKFNEEFKNQMTEFSDGNLFFEIMQREIWNRAHMDSTELKALYETNRTKYTWTKSADAIIFFCSDEKVAKLLYDQLKKSPASWRSIAESLSEKVVADSGRYEWSQIPSKTKIIPVNGMITSPLINPTDKTASFAYVLKTYPQPMARTYDEARGLVINDYQGLLEEQWMKKLKQKYPVTINQAVLSEISK